MSVAIGSSDIEVLGRNVKSARTAMRDLRDGSAVHGITDGRWSLTDALLAIAEKTGPCDVVVSTWTAGDADLRIAARGLRRARFNSLRLLVDRSFITRQPTYCEVARKLFGDEAIRVWSSHAKFAIFSGGEFDVLWLGSMNLNQNKRLESFSAFGGGPLPSEYLAIVNDLFMVQGAGEGFKTPARARRDQAKIIH